MRRGARWLPLLLLAGCTGLEHVDACRGVAGTCLSLEIEGSSTVSAVDSLALHITGTGLDAAKTTTGPGGRSATLPIAVGMVFDQVTSGTKVSVVIDATGYVAAVARGSGSTTAQLVGGAHASAHVQLETTAPLDLSVAADGSDARFPDLSARDLASLGADAAPLDAATDDLTPACSDSCADPQTLKHCRSDGTGTDNVTCPRGCATTPAAHCNTFYPTMPVAPVDLDGTGLVAVTLAASTTFHGDTGAIDGLRPINTDPAVREIKNGIAFHLVGGQGIFSFAGLTIPDGLTAHLAGPNPVALVSSADLALAGYTDAQGSCAAGGQIAGGGGGGVAGSQLDGSGSAGGGQGAGAGGASQGMSNCAGPGGGGGGHGDLGGKGGDSGCFVTAAGGAKGAAYDDVALTILRGGSGGGGAGAIGHIAAGGPGLGGNGGGSVHLVANGSIIIGGGAGQGGVNAGGCGGLGGGGMIGGGGGGGGGAILVEAPNVHLLNNGGLAANGGGGGCGSAADNGVNAYIGTTRALGSSCAGSQGGAGGGVGTVNGDDGITNVNAGGGGGGGAVGRIRLNSTTGAAIFDAGSVLSPALTDLSSTASAVASQGMIDVH